MPSIVLIDDDYASQILADTLRCRGFTVNRFGTALEAIEAIESIISADLVILDLIMERPEDDAILSIESGNITGISILQEIRTRNANVPVIVFSASTDSAVADALNGMPGTTFIPKWSSPSVKEFLRIVESAMGHSIVDPGPQSFIVHGHDDDSKLALKNFLQNTLHLLEPIILHEQPNLGRTIIEKFEAYASMSDLAFVLLTPDDPGADPNGSNTNKRRARQNVIFELGFFLGSIGRTSGRVFLLHKGPLELPSDLSGVVYVDISNGIEAAGETIRKEIDNVR